MRVRMRATLSGTRDGVEWPRAGGYIDLPDQEAEHLLAAGLAVAGGPAEESATPPAAEEKAVPSRRRTQAKKPAKE